MNSRPPKAVLPPKAVPPPRPVILSEAKNPHISRWPWLVLLILALAHPTPAQAQGCTQCRDTLASTHPATQQAYRRAILLITGAACTFAAATFIIIRRNP